jgi:hypothetical protein
MMSDGIIIGAQPLRLESRHRLDVCLGSLADVTRSSRSALTLKADIDRRIPNVRLVPETDIAPFYSITSSTMFDCDKLAICVHGPNCAHAIALFDIGENLFPTPSQSSFIKTFSETER